MVSTHVYVGDRVQFDPDWPMLARCRELGTTGVDQIGTILFIDRASQHSRWYTALVAWDDGTSSPSAMDNLVLAEEVTP